MPAFTIYILLNVTPDIILKYTRMPADNMQFIRLIYSQLVGTALCDKDCMCFFTPVLNLQSVRIFMGMKCPKYRY